MFFEPQPWEMPFDGAALEGSAETLNVCLDGTNLESQLRLVLSASQSRERGWKGRKSPLFSFADETLRDGFVICGEDSTYPLYSRYAVPCPADFAEAWEKGTIARLFWLNDSGTLRQQGEIACESLLVTASGVAVWHDYARSGGSSAFTWMQPLSSREFAEMAALDVWARIRHSLGEPGSEAEFARRFMHLDSDTKRTMIFNWRRGNVKQFQSLLHDILLSHGVWHETQQDQELRLTVYAPDEFEFSFGRFVPAPVEEPPSLRSAVERLCQRFEPFNSEIINRRCVRDWMRASRSGLEATALQPTIHERLEALLRWQDWLGAVEKRSE